MTQVRLQLTDPGERLQGRQESVRGVCIGVSKGRTGVPVEHPLRVATAWVELSGARVSARAPRTVPAGPDAHRPTGFPRRGRDGKLEHEPRAVLARGGCDPTAVARGHSRDDREAVTAQTAA
jgi:hypothetical protein